MIELKSIITNGHIDDSTIKGMEKKGWTLLSIIPAKELHPHALETDKLNIFGIYREMQDKEVGANRNE